MFTNKKEKASKIKIRTNMLFKIIQFVIIKCERGMDHLIYVFEFYFQNTLGGTCITLQFISILINRCGSQLTLCYVISLAPKDKLQHRTSYYPLLRRCGNIVRVGSGRGTGG